MHPGDWFELRVSLTGCFVGVRNGTVIHVFQRYSLDKSVLEVWCNSDWRTNLPPASARLCAEFSWLVVSSVPITLRRSRVDASQDGIVTCTALSGNVLAELPVAPGCTVGAFRSELASAVDKYPTSLVLVSSHCEILADD